MAALERRASGVEVVGHRAFNIEYETGSLDAALYDDIVSYLGEYRLQVQKYNYSLELSGQSAGGLCLCDPNDGEPMYAKAKRAIAERIRNGLPTHREEAELIALGDPDNLSNNSLAYQLRFAKNGDTLLWASPPGPRKEGYGDYGFLFVGKLNRGNLLKTRLSMTAIRIEHPTLNQYSAVVSELLGKEITFVHADQFLANPFVCKRGIVEMEIDNVLRKNFAFKPNKEDQMLFQNVIKELAPMIKEFMQLVKVGTKEEKLKAFYALENYALELKERFRKDRGERVVFMSEYRQVPRFNDFVRTYGYQPPTVDGSCGSSGSAKSNNPLVNGYQKLIEALFGVQEWFNCPKCGYKADGPVGDSCPSCGLTKEEHAKSGGEVCK